jgi:hypothetical protein
MEIFKTEAEKHFWTSLANTYISTQKKMRHERERLRKRLLLVERQLTDAREKNRETDLAFFLLYRRLLENLYESIELFNPDSNIMHVPEPAAIGAAEWHSLTAQVFLLQLDAINIGRLYSLVSADFETALMGQEVAFAAPRVWLKLRDKLAVLPEWQLALTKFIEEYPAFQRAMLQAKLEFEQLNELPPTKERINQAKALNLPALKGLHYRLESIFRRLPHGEELLGAVRVKAIEYPETEPDTELAPVSLKRSLTDKLLGFFNPAP